MAVFDSPIELHTYTKEEKAGVFDIEGAQARLPTWGTSTVEGDARRETEPFELQEP